MGWFWGARNNQDDPTKGLKPDLKEFLEQQQPKPYIPVQTSSSKPEDKSTTRPNLPDTNKTFEDRPLPKESLFQDGRYKDLWKTYVPQSEIVASTTTPVEQVMSARKDRRAGIHKAALENCVFEQELQQDCFSHGNLANRVRARMTMCHEETKTFNRCYQLQAKFLQALGYLTHPDSTDEDEERIQMHADKLYHRMMDYEADVDDAKRNNKAIPPLSSLFNPNRPAPTLEQMTLPKSLEERLNRPLRDLPPHERELAARAALQEAKMTNIYADDFFSYTTTMNEERKNRQTWLINLFGEPIGKFLIPDPPKSTAPKEDKLGDLEKTIWHDTGNTNLRNLPNKES